jgi:hypothetical protein
MDTLQAILKINSNAKVNIIKEQGKEEVITWLDGTAEISQADIDAKKVELQAIEDNLPNVKASAKTKLIAGEALTEDEANTIVL